jgi:hypothetical protein
MAADAKGIRAEVSHLILLTRDEALRLQRVATLDQKSS